MISTFPNNHLNSVAALIAICLCTFFINLGVVDINIMEARNLVTAREIVTNDNWLIPTMNDELRLEKPPLPTWFVSAVQVVSNGTDNLNILRLPNAISATLLVLFLYGFSWVFSKNLLISFLSSATAATCYLIISVGRVASWDIFCHTFMVGALWIFWQCQEKEPKVRNFLLFGIMLGLSFMSKGPVSFYTILLPFLISYLYIYGVSRLKTNRLLFLAAILLCLLISFWWPIYIFVKHPQISALVAQQETGAWGNRHLQPFWYYSYFPVFTGGWIIMTLAAFIKPYAEKRFSSKKEYTFLLLWLFITILLLSVIPEKKERYLFPAMIPTMLLIGHLSYGIIESFKKNRQTRGDSLVLAFHSALFAGLALCAPIVLFYLVKQSSQQLNIAYLVIFPAFWAIAWMIIRNYRKNKILNLFLSSVIFLTLTASTVMLCYRPLVYKNPDYQRMAKSDLDGFSQGLPVYRLAGSIDIKMVWDLEHQIRKWKEVEINQYLSSGSPVAVISDGDPSELIREKLHNDITIETLKTFDYRKSKPLKTKTYLSVVTPKLPGSQVQ